MKLRKLTKKVLVKPKRVVINRSKWAVGAFESQLGPTELLNRRGNMCCLGFVCYAAGVGSRDLLNRSLPSAMALVVPALTRLGVRDDDTGVCQTNLTVNAAEVNDTDPETLSLHAREKKLRALFRKSGIQLVFKGKYSKAVLNEQAKYDQIRPLS
jgi:hypothetical protein